MFLAILCIILQLKAHELVAPSGHDEDLPEDVDNFGMFQLYELFSKSTGVVHKLPDEAFSATTYYSDRYAPKNARIDMTEVKGNGIAWAAKNNKGDALTVDMKTSRIVTGVATQGRADDNQYVTRYSVEVSESGTEWESQGEFVGNFNHLTVTQVRFETPVFARFVKFTVLKYHSHASMRVDVLVYEPKYN